MLFKEISTTGAINAVWGNFKSLGSLCHLRRYQLQESWIKCGNLKCFKSFQTAQAIHYFKYHSPAINIMVQTFFIIKQRKQHKGCQWEECHLDKNVGRREVPVFLADHQRFCCRSLVFGEKRVGTSAGKCNILSWYFTSLKELLNGMGWWNKHYETYKIITNWWNNVSLEMKLRWRTCSNSLSFIQVDNLRWRTCSS